VPRESDNTDLVQTPFQRIVAELRRRIDEGELKPGDRLPSTRALAAEWGVALATAARALTELRQAGVVRSQSRVGSIVAPPGRPRRVPPETELTRARVVRAGVELADAEGLDALSMRTVAARLNVATMSLYRHVEGKDQLVLLMADAAYAEDDYPPVPPAGWRARLELGARTLWRLYGRHPWLTQLGPLARPLLLPNLARHGEWTLAALNDLGLPATRVLDLQILLYSYGQGLAVNIEREAHAQADTGVSDEQWVEAQGPVLAEFSGKFPNFARMIGGLPASGYDFNLDALFETGLQTMLDGFASLIAREAAQSVAD
jgi:DNA-binding transcriptional regulator YhcF (GntR family)